MPADAYLSTRDDPMTEDPLPGFAFLLEVNGKVAGYFTECSGIGSENEIIEHKVVDNNGHDVVRKIPGRLKWGDVTLKRGITSDMEVWEWRDKVVQGDMTSARRNCSIMMMDRNYNAVAQWDFLNAWPIKVTGPSLKSDSNEFGVEEMTLAHEGISRKN